MSPYFTVEGCTSVESLPLKSHVHVIGICGVAMAQIAIELSRQGFSVSGSDREFYEPMGGLLKKESLQLFSGYDASNIPAETSLVVIGNAISKDNPEVRLVEINKLPYTIFPKILGEVLIGKRTSIVVAGTHGKSTTTALAAQALVTAQAEPSYFIGGVVKGLSGSLAIGKGNVSVVEGDEYDSAFFAKVPKFYFYKPQILILTSIEFDHADIYSSLDAIEAVFLHGVKSVPENGLIIACVDCPVIQRSIEKWKAVAKAPIITYGTTSLAQAKIVKRNFHDGLQSVTVEIENESGVVLSNIPMLGEHNAKNATAVYLALKAAGISFEKIGAGLQSFQGVKRRQEVRFVSKDVTVIEDFAHHPTAVRETLSAIKEGYPGKRILCVFEPRSNTSRRKVFEDDYGTAFKSADVAILRNVQARHNDDGIALMDTEAVMENITAHGSKARLFSTADEIVNYLLETQKANDLIVIMSNGSFDGLIDKLVERLQSNV